MKPLALLFLLALSACSGLVPTGQPLQGEAPPNVLTNTACAGSPVMFWCEAGSATVIVPGWAAVPAHAASVGGMER